MGRSKNRFQLSDLREAFTQMRRLTPYAFPYWPRLVVYLAATTLYWVGNAGRALVIGPFIAIASGAVKHGTEVTGNASDVEQTIRDKFGHGTAAFVDSVGIPILWTLPLVLLVAGIAQAIGTWGKQYQMNWLMNRATVDVQRDLAKHLMRQPVSFFNQNRKGELMSRVTNDLGGVRATFSIVYNDLFHHPIGIITMLAMAIYTSPQLSLATLFLPLVLLPVIAFAGKIKRLSRASYETAAELSNFFHQFFEGVRVVKAYGMEGEQVKELDRASLTYFNRSVKVGKYKGLSRALVEMVVGLMTAAALAAGLWLLSNDIFGERIEFGTVVQFIALLALMYDPIRQFSHTLNNMSEAMAANERVFAMMDRVPELLDAPDAKPAPMLSREITFDRVSFEYIPGRPVIYDVSFTAKKGTMTAFVGPTGAGKSTLLDLIPRFYAPTGGRVLVDGVDLATVAHATWLAQIAVVAQETFLFNTSVRDNLLAGKPGATDDELIDALRAANILDEIMSLPKKLDSHLGDRGVTLSGGQRQRLAIARAFVKRAPVLLLDEATSALDTETERKVQQALERLIEGATVFAIAHRLSTIVHADQILVVEGGRITERGSHSELIKAQGRYAVLYRTQAG
jgi:subfamily B ATP-binding cassette protein MsbA